MATGYGMRSHIQWNMQTSYGTNLTNSQFAIPIISENLSLSIEPLVEQNMYSRFGESPYHEGVHIVQGDINMEAHPVAMGWLMRSVLGGVDTTSSENTQTHVMIPVESDFDDRAAVLPATAEVHRDVGSAFILYDLVGNTISWEIANGQLVKVTAGFIGAGFTRKAASSPTYDTSKPFIWDQVSAQYNGALMPDIRNLTITVNNQLEAMYTLASSKAPYRIKKTGPTMIEISGRATFAAHSYQQAFEAQSEVPFVFNIGGQQVPNRLEFDIPSFRFKTFEPRVEGPGIVEADFTAQAVFNVNSNAALQVTLVNCHPDYIGTVL